MELFNSHLDLDHQPLAFRMRPRTLDEYVGQQHIVGHGRLLRRAIQADQLSSLILYGPPGTGKTTLARVVANSTQSHFTTLNAVLSGVKELRYELEQAKERLSYHKRRTILFVDEVHRWNKSQQDALLPWVENGTVILIGATTENPFFEVNSALVSRSRIFQLVKLTDEDLMKIAIQAINDKERGYGKWQIEFEKGALEHLVSIANGDARSLLNALELAVETTSESFPPPVDSIIEISKEAAEESIQKKIVLYDKEGDYHFDTISAFIKSIRGSDADAALYWLARMVKAGEDPSFIFRRLLISATEDVGLADPNAIAVVLADAAAFERIGYPEGQFHLSHATLYLATAPKSNSTLAFFDALKAVEEESDADIPNHLKDGNRDKKGFGHGKGYLYPHAFVEHWVAQQYLPTALQGKVFYNPSHSGYEKIIRDVVLRKRELQLESVMDETFEENLTYSASDTKKEMWLNRALGERTTFLATIRERVFEYAKIRRHDRVLILNAKNGFFVWEAMRQAPEGLVVAHQSNSNFMQQLEHQSMVFDLLERPTVINSLETIEAGIKFERIVGYNVFSRLSDLLPTLQQLKTFIDKESLLIFAQPIFIESSFISHFINDETLKEVFKKAEGQIYKEEFGYNSAKLISLFEKEGFVVENQILSGSEQRYFHKNTLLGYLENTYIPALNDLKIVYEKEVLLKQLYSDLSEKPLVWKKKIAILKVGLPI
jgi:putative ATPase